MKLRILLIDDATFIRDLIKRTLKKFLPTSEIIEAPDGRKAQVLLGKQNFDLILSDWEMPGLSGEELLIWVRAQEKLATVPFIMISSLGDKTHIVRAVECGVSDYLGKPFTAEELMQKVQKALLRSGRLKTPQASATQSTGVFSSVEIFSTRGEIPVGSSAETLTAASVTETKAAKMKGTGLIHFEDLQIKCMIKAIDNDEMSVIARRGTRHPGVLERVQIDLSAGNDIDSILTGLAGYIHSIAAVEKKPDAEFLSVIVRFDTTHEHTKERLSQFLSGNSQEN
ncbi:MAG: response regulator [Gammaproteobacteria bacterium]|nr:response regulator [Gammaproteobacteria bacterium]MDP2139614.1 response regulator [Gammaproteobacteria bacterium]MDP2346587.1 response regulator [Gammaproteobacteria bacterium]